jgi:urea carboxylase
VAWPRHARVETWVESGSEVTPFYDPMLAKIIVHGDDRPGALQRLRAALAECQVAGVETNLEYLRQVCADPAFEAGGILTAYLRDFPYRRRAVDVIEPGTQTTIQDYPGRIGYWHVGVPPSGPMDALALRVANRLVGNPESAAGLEIAVTGPTLRFACDATIAITGADFGASLPTWRAVAVEAGDVLEMPHAQAAGSRAYIAIAGGFDVPDYLGSRSTFILGRFGGHAGRVLAAGDVLHVGQALACPGPGVAPPPYANRWEIGVLYGPHGAPDFFTDGDIEMFFATWWKVHYNSDRTGVRLIGPKPVWARQDGGEAGLHPSNIHDNAYAIGTVDFTGDMPVILGPDGPGNRRRCRALENRPVAAGRSGALPGDLARSGACDRARSEHGYRVALGRVAGVAGRRETGRTDSRGADTRVCSAETHLGGTGREESRPSRQECLRHNLSRRRGQASPRRVRPQRARSQPALPRARARSAAARR